MKSYFTKSAFTELLIEQKGVQTLIQSKKKAKSKDGELKPLKEITKDYVFTEDNLIKMCLLLIRIRANMPVVMMGKTRYVKTNLIKILS